MCDYLQYRLFLALKLKAGLQLYNQGCKLNFDLELKELSIFPELELSLKKCSVSSRSIFEKLQLKK